VKIGGDGEYDDSSTFEYTSPPAKDKEDDEIGINFLYTTFPALRLKKLEDNTFFIKVDRSMLTVTDSKSHEVTV
jgi:hypothetical protein